MAILIVYDDSDGLYDHQLPPLANASNTAFDWLTGPGACGTSGPGAYQARCGFGPRLPLLLVSRFAKRNFVDHTLTDQSSIIRFIEDNWRLGRIGDQSFDERAGSIGNMFDFSDEGGGRRPLILDPATGQVIRDGGSDGDGDDDHDGDHHHDRDHDGDRRGREPCRGAPERPALRALVRHRRAGRYNRDVMKPPARYARRSP